MKRPTVPPFAVLNGQMWIAVRHGLTMAGLLDLPDAGAQLLVDAYREIGTEIMTSGCAAAWLMMEVMGGTVNMDTISAEILTRPLGSLEEIRGYDVMKVIADMRAEHYYGRTLVQMREMRRIVGDECMIGGGFFGPFTMAAQMLGVEDFMVEMIAGEVYAISRSLCESMKPYGGFILAPGCDLAPNIPLENLKAMARAAREAK